MLLQVLPWVKLSPVGERPAPCSHKEIELYDPTDQRRTLCWTCPECPKGQGLTPQCGSRVPNDTKVECKLCQANVSFSIYHSIESCKACQECGLRNVIRHCTPDKNRECGSECPKGYFLDDNLICQECYFCCDSVNDALRRQGCIRIGMAKNWQCEKTEQNQRCMDQALKKETTTLTDTELTVPPYPNNSSEKNVKTQIQDKFVTTLPHQPGKNLTQSQTLSVDRSTPNTIQEKENLRVPVKRDNSANAAQSMEDKKKEHEGVSLRVVLGVATIILIISTLAILTSKRVHQFCRFSRTNQTNPSGENETDKEM